MKLWGALYAARNNNKAKVWEYFEILRLQTARVIMAQFSLTFWFAQGKKNLKSVESDSDPSTSSSRSDNDEKLQCIEEVQAHLKSKTVAENKQTNKPTKKTKEQSTRALVPNAYTISNNSLGTRPHFPNLIQT